jgi:hypothetical protein
MDSLLYAILGSLLRNRFVSLLWIRQTGYLRAWKAVPSCLQRVLSRFFFPPSPSFLDHRWVKNDRDPENIWYEVILLHVKEPV